METEYKIINFLRNDLNESFEVEFEESASLLIKMHNGVNIERFGVEEYAIIVNGETVFTICLTQSDVDDYEVIDWKYQQLMQTIEIIIRLKNK